MFVFFCGCEQGGSFFFFLQVAEEFVKLGGLSLLEAFQYNAEEEIRRKATHLLERHLLSS